MAKPAVVGDEKYVNWISAAKTQLQTRESVLLQKRSKLCDEIIIASIKTFTKENTESFAVHINKGKVYINVNRMEEVNYAIYYEFRNNITDSNSPMMQEYIKCIQKQLRNWKGWNAPKQIQAVHTFADYFKLIKDGWDAHKLNIMSDFFWHPITIVIQAFTKAAASEFFSDRFFAIQKLYRTYLSDLILKDLVQATVRISDSEILLLISDCLALANDAGKLTIVAMRQGGEKKGLYQQRIILANKQCETFKRNFQKTLLDLHYEVDNYGHQDVNNNNNNNNNNMHQTCTNNNNGMNINGYPTIPSNQLNESLHKACNCVQAVTIPPISSNVQDCSYMNHHHQSNYNVKDIRYNPLLRR